MPKQLNIFLQPSISPVFAAILQTTGEYWDFHKMEWTNTFKANCLTTIQEVKYAKWKECGVTIHEYQLVLDRTYKERENNETKTII